MQDYNIIFLAKLLKILNNTNLEIATIMIIITGKKIANFHKSNIGKARQGTDMATSKEKEK